MKQLGKSSMLPKVLVLYSTVALPILGVSCSRPRTSAVPTAVSRVLSGVTACLFQPCEDIEWSCISYIRQYELIVSQ